MIKTCHMQCMQAEGMGPSRVEDVAEGGRLAHSSTDGKVSTAGSLFHVLLAQRPGVTYMDFVCRK